MNDLKIFKNQEFGNIRTVFDKEKEPWFKGQIYFTNKLLGEQS